MISLVLRPLAFLLLAALVATPGEAGEWTPSGHAGVEARHFWAAPRWAGQRDGGALSLRLQPELRWRSDDGLQRAALVGFARLDGADDRRSHADLREAYWAREGDGWDLLVGVDRVFWGVTESRHLVDVINQDDLVEDPDGETKLGQPMVRLDLQRDWGRVGLFVLPGFRERTFPGRHGRLRTPLPVAVDRPRYESAAGAGHVDVALRYSHYVGDLDLGLHLFDGTGREPRFEPTADGTRLRPVYEQVTQAGVDLQYTRDAWLWKLEALVRERRAAETFGAFVAGLEYTFYQLREGPDDLGVLLELLYDGRGDAAPPTLADRDLFVAARWAWNDAADTSVLAGVQVDAETGETVVNVEAERRLDDHLVGELRLRHFAGAEPGGVLDALARDSYLQINLDWYW